MTFPRLLVSPSPRILLFSSPLPPLSPPHCPSVRPAALSGLVFGMHNLFPPPYLLRLPTLCRRAVLPSLSPSVPRLPRLPPIKVYSSLFASNNRRCHPLTDARAAPHPAPHHAEPQSQIPVDRRAQVPITRRTDADGRRDRSSGRGR